MLICLNEVQTVEARIEATSWQINTEEGPHYGHAASAVRELWALASLCPRTWEDSPVLGESSGARILRCPRVTFLQGG